jgi:hypothetical protein
MSKCQNVKIRLKSKLSYLIFTLFIMMLTQSCQQSSKGEISPKNMDKVESKQVQSNSTQSPVMSSSKWSNEDWNQYFMMSLMEEMSNSNKRYTLQISDGLLSAVEDNSGITPPSESVTCRLATNSHPVYDYGKIKGFIQCVIGILDKCGNASLSKEGGEYVARGC